MRFMDLIGHGFTRLTALPTRRPAVDAPPLSGLILVFPAIGLVIGFLGALAFALAFYIGLPSGISAILASLAMSAVTGAWGERGLAAFIGTWQRPDAVSALSGMMERRVETAAVIALAATLLLRSSALTALGAPLHVFDALISAWAVGYAISGLSLFLLPEVGVLEDGHRTGRAEPVDVAWALIVAVVIAVFSLGFGTALAVLLAAVAAGLAVLAVAQAKLGGQTEEVAAAVQICAEIAALLAAIAVVGTTE